MHRAVATFDPPNSDHAPPLGGAQIASGDGPGALAPAASLRKLPAPISDAPRIDYLEVSAHGSQGDYIKEGVSAERAVQNAKKHGAMLLAAQSLRLGCWASMEIGQSEKALAQCQEAMEIFSRAGDRGGAASALGNQPAVLDSRGDRPGALAKYHQSLPVLPHPVPHPRLPRHLLK